MRSQNAILQYRLQLYIITTQVLAIHNYNIGYSYSVFVRVLSCRVFLTNRLHYIPGYHNADTTVGREAYRGMNTKTFSIVGAFSRSASLMCLFGRSTLQLGTLSVLRVLRVCVCMCVLCCCCCCCCLLVVVVVVVFDLVTAVTDFIKKGPFMDGKMYQELYKFTDRQVVTHGS